MALVTAVVDRRRGSPDGVLRLAAALKSLDDDHAGATARAWTRQHAGLVDRCFGRLWFFWAGRHGEQLARVDNVCGSGAGGEQAIVPDAMEALRQHVDQKAPDELIGRQRHGLVAGGPLDAIILVLEGKALRCPCGCGEMAKIGEDVSERLDVIPAQLRVLVTRRPKYACRRHQAMEG